MAKGVGVDINITQEQLSTNLYFVIVKVFVVAM
jgi:hypothetical protein